MDPRPQLSDRVWAAGKVAAASFAGPAGMAVASGLVCAASYGAAVLMSPEAAGAPFSTPQGLMVGAAGLGAALAGASALPAAAMGFAKSMSGAVGPRASSLKESLMDAWSAARELMIHGAVGVGALSAVAWGNSLASAPGWTGAAVGLAVCAPLFLIGSLAGAGGVGLAAKTAADNTGAALGASGSLIERQRRLAQENDPSLVELLASRAAASVGSKLARWRQSKATTDDSALGPQTPRV